MIKKATNEKVTLPYFVTDGYKEEFVAEIEAYNANLMRAGNEGIEYEVEPHSGDFYVWIHCHPIDLLLLGKRLP